VLITGFATGSAEANCYLVATRPGAPALVVDPGEQAVQTLEYYFTANDLTPAAVLLTHGHATHTASAFDLCAGWDIPAYLHPADRDLVAELSDEVIEVADGQRLDIGGITVDVHHTPGHSPGSVTYAVAADTDEGLIPVLFTGDTLLSRSLGGTGDHARMLAAVRDKLLAYDDIAVVLPGHGTSTSIGAERRWNPELKRITHP